MAFLDEGQVWNVSDTDYTFDPKASVGIGLQFGEDDSVVVVNVPGLHSGRDDSFSELTLQKPLNRVSVFKLRRLGITVSNLSVHCDLCP